MTTGCCSTWFSGCALTAFWCHAVAFYWCESSQLHPYKLFTPDLFHSNKGELFPVCDLPSCLCRSSTVTGDSVRERLSSSFLFSAWSWVVWDSRSWTSPLHTSSSSSSSWDTDTQWGDEGSAAALRQHSNTNNITSVLNRNYFVLSFINVHSVHSLSTVYPSSFGPVTRRANT